MSYTHSTNWEYAKPNIRSRETEKFDPQGQLIRDYEFQIYKRPYFFWTYRKEEMGVDYYYK